MASDTLRHFMPQFVAVTRRHMGLHLAVALAAAVFAGVMAQNGFPGSAIALVPLLTIAVLALERLKSRWTRPRVTTCFLACGSCAAAALDPGPLNIAMLWLSLGAMALAVRGNSLDNLLQAFHVLSTRGAFAMVFALEDAGRIRAYRYRRRSIKPGLDWRHAVLPLAAAGAFAVLLTSANPIFEALWKIVSWADLLAVIWTWPTLVTIAVFVALWTLLRTKALSPASSPNFDVAAPQWHRNYFAPFPVAVTLLVLNGMFLVQNALDARYLWSGGILPEGLTYAMYAQRGASTLVLTVLLAAGLVVIALWPGSRTEASASIRGLVYLWLGQNVFLVASCALRTFAYVDAYGMTELRLAALAWMGLITVGLALVAIRIVTKRRNLWLVNSNIAAVFLVLWMASFVDGAAIVANHNVNRALAGADLDFDYLYSLGPSAISPFKRYAEQATYKHHPAGLENPAATKAARWAEILERRLDRTQADWRTWTIRGALLAPPEL